MPSIGSGSEVPRFGPLTAAGGRIEPIPPLAGRPEPGNYPPAQPGTGPGQGGWQYGPTPLGSPPIGHPLPAADAPPVAPAPPGDGPDPADDVALHDVQRLLSLSLALAGDLEAVAARLRDALVLAQPRLAAVLPGTEATQRDQLAQALSWLVAHLDDPPAMAAGCGQLGAVLREFGLQPHQLQLIGAALAEAMRAGMVHGWRQEYDTAWRSTWQHVQQWMEHGAAQAAYRPITWTAVVTGHERRRSDLAVLRLRPYLPMPYLPGQYARIEVATLPGVWRPYSLAGSPRLDNVLEMHVRAKSETGVSGTLVHHTGVGDTVRLSRAEGTMALPPATGGRDLLFIAGDTGVAPLKALLTELAATADPRSAVLFWGARTLGDLYDLDEVTEIARDCRRATVVPVISEGEPGPYAAGLVTDAIAAYGEWSRHEVYLAGPPPMLAATRAVLGTLGIAPERIHHDPADVDNPSVDAASR